MRETDAQGAESAPRAQSAESAQRSPSFLPDAAAAAEALPGLVKFAATSAWRAGRWGVATGLRTTRKAFEVATNPQTAVEVAQGVATASGVIADLAKQVSNGVPVPEAVMQVGGNLRQQAVAEHRATREDRAAQRVEAEQQSLREQGAALLARSRDVWSNDAGHPAYARILGEMAPDEGRILLLLLKGGPQPSVDVRTGGAIGLVSSNLVAPGLNMIGPRAGVRYGDQVPSYLNNLFRLGLIWFSREQINDPLAYQVVEAQPDVQEAMASVRTSKIVRRSVHLTPFGEDFCRTCLLAEDDDVSALPEHQAPQDLD